MPFLPLVAHTSPDDIVAWRADGAVTLREFLVEVNELAASFPAQAHLLNLCSDRYRFSVGLAAAIVAGKISLLPPAHTPQALCQIRNFAPDVFCLTDSDLCTVEMPLLRYPNLRQTKAHVFAIPQIDRNQRVAVLFTSGSTGTPQPHGKNWGALVGSMQAEASRLGLLAGVPVNIVGTVPPQHMYGFESTVLVAWFSACAFSHAQPFYPVDICRALLSVPVPRLLVSTPVHLRALLEAELALPDVASVLSATAPLSDKLAHDVEAAFNAPLREIYGSTETGVIATRRTTQGAQWDLLPGVRLTVAADGVRAHGGHVEIPILLNDVVESVSDEHFLLHGRLADLVNIAGKRHSLAGLNLLLNSIPGVQDGVFHMPDESDDDRITRLAACVVAPGLTAPQLLRELRKCIDPVFLPRPLIFVEKLPRNAAGKLPRATLQALIISNSTTWPGHENVIPWTVPADHPAFAGHFPGTPIVPGVLLLETALHAIAEATGMALDVCTINSVKFLSPANPGDEVAVVHTISASGSIHFHVVAGARKLASGSISPGAPA